MFLGDFNGHIDGVHGGYGVGQRNLVERMLLEFCMEKSYMCQVHGLREQKRGR